nr:hypothetical protein [uncultured Pseudodesulfovibrio sp.]
MQTAQASMMSTPGTTSPQGEPSKNPDRIVTSLSDAKADSEPATEPMPAEMTANTAKYIPFFCIVPLLPQYYL